MQLKLSKYFLFKTLKAKKWKQNKINKEKKKTKKLEKKIKKCHLPGHHSLNTTRNPTMGQDSGPQQAQ